MIGVFRVKGLYGVQGYVGSDLQAFFGRPSTQLENSCICQSLALYRHLPLLTHRAALEAAMSGRAFAPAPEPEQHVDLCSFNPAETWEKPAAGKSWEAVALALGHLDMAEYLEP